MPSGDDLVRIQQAHHRRFLGVQDATADLVGTAWDSFAGLDDIAAAEFAATAGFLVDTAKVQTSTLAVAYMTANDRAGGFPVSGLLPTLPEIRGGIPTPEVYHRSIVEARALVSRGVPFDDAMSAGRARATGTAKTDVTLVNKAEMNRGGELRPWVVGYRRVLTGRSCAFCATASTQRYKSADLLPIHQRCDCDVAEIFGTEDPGRIINRGLLDELKDAGRTSGEANYWQGPYVVEADGTIHYKKVEKVLDDKGTPLLGPDGQPLRRTVAGPRVKPEVVEHRELGPTLTDSRHETTTARELPRNAAPSSTTGRPPSSAPSSSDPIRRTRATAKDPDVLAEASRRNVTPDRMIELREQKAARRFLEDRARREATKSLSADSADVRAVAEKFGVHPDEVLSARARVADVRKIAREEAARVQADALDELDRLGTIRLKNPPRLGAKTDIGTSARRGEFDWLEQVSDREKARLSRKWYGGTQAPDQFAGTISDALGRDVDVDEAMRIWLDLNRREEAAGALRRGKIPSPDAYSGQIDTSSILRELADQGFDPELIFGDDLAAAGHVAQVEQELVRRETLDYLGEALSPVEGPSPYRMSFQSWETEVRDLEYLIRNNLADVADRRRYAELVPQYIDEPGLDFEDLYARIITTARKAGEEVPDYAAIPWQ